jgi:hypothetical protein
MASFVILCLQILQRHPGLTGSWVVRQGEGNLFALNTERKVTISLRLNMEAL